LAINARTLAFYRLGQTLFEIAAIDGDGRARRLVTCWSILLSAGVTLSSVFTVIFTGLKGVEMAMKPR
jgi:hypothetical protein